MEREPGTLYRDHQRRHAEQRAVHRIAVLAVQMALTERAAGGDEHGLMRPEQEQRCEIHRVRHRHRRAAGREREIHLQRR